jgi:hypothetical protein
MVNAVRIRISHNCEFFLYLVACTVHPKIQTDVEEWAIFKYSTVLSGIDVGATILFNSVLARS